MVPPSGSRDVEAELRPGKDQRVGVRERLVERPLVAGRLDLPAGQQLGDHFAEASYSGVPVSRPLYFGEAISFT